MVDELKSPVRVRAGLSSFRQGRIYCLLDSANCTKGISVKDVIESLLELFTEHWTKVAIGAALMAAGWIVGWWRARNKWERKEFFERINFSLNSINDGKLQIRTLMEKACDDVFLNQVAVAKLLEASQKTTQEDPLIPLGHEDYWFYLNAALNEVSEKFAAGFVLRDLGREVTPHDYTLCLTNECDGAVRTRKIRAMLIRTEILKNLPEEIPELESKNHVTRWKTLCTMARLLETQPHLFFRVELVF